MHISFIPFVRRPDGELIKGVHELRILNMNKLGAGIDACER